MSRTEKGKVIYLRRADLTMTAHYKRFLEVTAGRELPWKRVEGELREWASKSVTSRRNSSPFKYFLSYPRRCFELAAGIHKLLGSHVVPAIVVARALLETNAMGCLFIHEACRLDLDGSRWQAKLDRFLIGSTNSDVKPIHVMDAIRHLQGLDLEYFKDLVGEADPRKVSALLPKIAETSLELAYENISVAKTYGYLSEFAHPNMLGTHGPFREHAEHAEVDENLQRETLAP